MRKLALIAVAALLTPAVFAQGRGSFSGHAPSPGFAGRTTVHPGFAPSGRNGFRFAVGEHSRGRSFRNYGYYGWPYYADYPDYYDSYEEPPAPPQPAPAIQPQISNQPLPAPALLELQGNQWVKVNNFTMPGNQLSPVQATAAVVTSKDMPLAILVYRDGHTEELSSYTIIDGSIHTRSDYWTNGAWIRTIQIADLDIPATLKQNQDRGVKFDLPSSPNEVIIRP